MSITSMMEIAFDTDVHMCDEISLFIIDDVPTTSVRFKPVSGKLEFDVQLDVDSKHFDKKFICRRFPPISRSLSRGTPSPS